VIDIDKIVDNTDISTKYNFVSKKGLFFDLEKLIDEYVNYLKSQKRSSNTIRSYKFTLEAFLLFSKRYLDDKKDITIFQDYNIVNEFLNFISKYEINKTYQTLKERLKILSDFLIEHKPIDYNQYLDFMNEYINKADIDNIDSTINILDSFGNFLDYKSMKKISYNNEDINNLVAEFYTYQSDIEGIASNKTMMLRKATITAFLSYIEKISKKEIVYRDTFIFYNSYSNEKSLLKREKPFDEEEVKNILSFLDHYPTSYKNYNVKSKKSSEYVAYRDCLLILVMMHGGCRVAEVLGIKFSDITERNDFYDINVLGKGNKKRKIYIKKSEIVRHYEWVKANKRGEYISSNSIDGSPIKYEHIKRFANSIFRLQGIDKSGLHVLRHFFASRFVEGNANINILKELLGHSSISTTELYSHIGEKAKEEAIRGL
jgi:site-specific recombinase XerD